MTVETRQLAARPFLPRMTLDLHRGEYFAGLFAVGFASAFTERIKFEIAILGLDQAILRTFDISVIIWVSCVAGILLVLRDRARGISQFELAMGAGFLILVILPIGPLSTIAITGLSLYIIISTDLDSSRRGAFILLATTVPVLWSCMLFRLFANFILSIDASLVSWLLGTPRIGNLVEFADHSGQLVIFPACSSVANVSLALLSWVTVTQLVSHRRSLYDVLWCLFACAAVVGVNVVRMAFLGLTAWNYATFHNEWGDAVFNMITLFLIVGICAWGVRDELNHRI